MERGEIIVKKKSVRVRLPFNITVWRERENENVENGKKIMGYMVIK